MILKLMPDGFQSNRMELSPKLVSKLWNEGSILVYVRGCEVLSLCDNVFLGRFELFLLELVLITWVYKLTILSDSCYSIFPSYAGSLPSST